MMAKTFPEWTPTKGNPLGEVQYYYPGKRAGSRAAWSCKWTVLGGPRGNRTMQPTEWPGCRDIGGMSQPELYCEMADIAARSPDPSNGLSGHFVAAAGPSLEFPTGGWFITLESEIRSKLGLWRQTYHEYCANWDDVIPAAFSTDGHSLFYVTPAWRPDWHKVPFSEPVALGG